MCFLNPHLIKRKQRCEGANALVIILILILFITALLYEISTSFDTCEGLFGDSVHLNLERHANYKKFTQGRCAENYRSTNNRIQDFSYVARLVYLHSNIKTIGCSGSLISGKFL